MRDPRDRTRAPKYCGHLSPAPSRGRAILISTQCMPQAALIDSVAEWKEDLGARGDIPLCCVLMFLPSLATTVHLRVKSQIYMANLPTSLITYCILSENGTLY